MARRETPKLGSKLREITGSQAAEAPVPPVREPQPQAQSYSAPRGYDEKVWALARVWTDGAVWQGTAPGTGLPGVYHRLTEVYFPVLDTPGFAYLAALTVTRFWGETVAEYSDPWLDQYCRQFPELWGHVTGQRERETEREILARKHAENRRRLNDPSTWRRVTDPATGRRHTIMTENDEYYWGHL